jgi:predicted Ser/Thr protein kinase
MKFKKIRLIAKGWSSYVWLVSGANAGKKNTNQNSKLILKEVREKSPRKNLAEREGTYLKKANTVNVGPRLCEANLKKNYVLMEYIEGPKLIDWILEEKYSREELYFFIKELYGQLLRLDEIHTSHNQLQVGKNILVAKKKIIQAVGKNISAKNGKLIEKEMPFPVIIDFEKATTKEHTKNIGQIESFLFYNPNSLVAKKVREVLELELRN